MSDPDWANDSKDLKIEGKRKTIRIDAIHLDNERRSLSENKVQSLMLSIKEEGLLHPIVVFRNKRLGKRYWLSSGAHRLEAVQRLGFDCIEVTIIDGKSGELWADSENLQRNELTILDRSESIVRFARASKNLLGISVKGGNQPNDLGYAKVSKRLGYDRKIVAEAFSHEQLSSEIKLLVRTKGMANKRSLLNRLCKCSTVEEQRRVLDGATEQPKNAKRKYVPELAEPEEEKLTRLLRRWFKSPISERFTRLPVEVRRAFVERILLG